MYYALIVIHVFVCLFLIASILLQAGRGGGLTESFSGQTQSVFGTQAPVILKRATEIGAIVFLIVSLLLAMLTARRSQSLFQQYGLPEGLNLPLNAETVPVEAAKDLDVPEDATVPVENVQEAVK